MIKGNSAQTNVENDFIKYGCKGKNGNWPGCTEEFVNRTKKRRKKNKQARKSRKANRK